MAWRRLGRARDVIVSLIEVCFAAPASPAPVSAVCFDQTGTRSRRSGRRASAPAPEWCFTFPADAEEVAVFSPIGSGGYRKIRSPLPSSPRPRRQPEPRQREARLVNRLLSCSLCGRTRSFLSERGEPAPRQYDLALQEGWRTRVFIDSSAARYRIGTLCPRCVASGVVRHRGF